MRIKEFRADFNNQLSKIYPQTEIDAFFFLLLEEYLSLQRVELIMQPSLEIPIEKESLFKSALERLLKEEPIQYIVGNTEFYGLPFKVTSNTLIPRPETEELVDWILADTKNNTLNQGNESFSVLDIGTGTGCIPISLKKHLTTAQISAIDVSKEALVVAIENAKLNKVAINFIQEDILKATELPSKFNVIVSNPPYVRNLEKVEIKNNVLENEPHLALFVEDDDPLIFYSKIADLAKEYLTEKGVLFFEINQYLGKETIAMLKNKGFKNIELRKDFSNNDRMIKASL